MNVMKYKYRFGLLLTAHLVLVLFQLNANNTFNSLFASANTKTPIASKSTNDAKTTVTALGRILPKDKIISLSGSSDLPTVGVAKILVKEGDKVKQGQLLAILDNVDRLRATLQQARQKVAVAEARLMQARAGQAKKGEIAAQEANIDNLNAQFSGEISTQKANISRLKAELQHQIAAQDAENMRLQAEWEHAKAECDRYEALFKDGAVSASIRESKCLEKQTTQEQLNVGDANKKRIRETLTQQIREAQALLNKTLSSYPKQIKEAKANLQQVIEVRPVDVQVAEAELKQAKAAVIEAQTNLDSAYVKAPTDAEVLNINTFAGEKISSQGIVDIAQTQQMYVIAEVYETEIEQIRVGQTATITSSAFKNKLQGKVEQISAKVGKKDVLNSDPTLEVDARVVEVKIHLRPESSVQAANLINLEVEVAIDTKS
ncbi:ABC exporter membrane fusion protein [Nostoc sp. UHCC 0702]|nr:ABC exporter membrane fusion protein [Nostoc sp. UHCC 0702]